jgi:hypothetical protein
VHGLWPETGQYGTSRCVAPSVSSAAPTAVASCYDVPGTEPSHQLSFEVHEWEKHGVCAGVKDAQDYFDQICAISKAPLAVVAATVSSGGDVSKAASDLRAAGYSVFAVDSTNAQVELTACADVSGTWHLAAAGDFGRVCGVGPPAPGPAPPSAQCVPSAHGPPCRTDADCVSVPHCVRCAHSGYCTMVPLPAREAVAVGGVVVEAA